MFFRACSLYGLIVQIRYLVLTSFMSHKPERYITYNHWHSFYGLNLKPNMTDQGIKAALHCALHTVSVFSVDLCWSLPNSSLIMRNLRIAGLGYLLRVLHPVADFLLFFSSGSFKRRRPSGWAFVLSSGFYRIFSLLLLNSCVPWIVFLEGKHFLFIVYVSALLSLLFFPRTWCSVRHFRDEGWEREMTPVRSEGQEL